MKFCDLETYLKKEKLHMIFVETFHFCHALYIILSKERIYEKHIDFGKIIMFENIVIAFRSNYPNNELS